MSLLHRRIALAGVGLAVAATTVLSTATASYAASSVNPVQAAAGWLSTQFVGSTYLPSPTGDFFGGKYDGTYYPNYGENADVIFGLAAAKAGKAKIDTAFDYLAKNLNAYADLSDSDGYGPSDGAVGKIALAAIVAGKSPTDVGGRNLMATLAKDECPTGSTSCTPGSAANIYSSVSESLVVTAEARVGGASAPTANALTYLLSLQCKNGGFTVNPTACGSGAADLDSTSYAIMALTAVGGHPSELSKARKWLTGQQHSGGYWVSQNVPNVNSTGLAAAALSGTGATVTKARHWLLTQQIGAGKAGAGAMRFAGAFAPTTASATSPSVLATAQGLTGLVDNGGLATLTAAGASSGVSLLAPTAALSSTAVRAGDEQTVTAHGFAAGERVTATLHSKEVEVGSAKADASGAVSIRYRVPASIGAGAHSVVLLGASSGLTVSQALTVTSATSTAPSSTPVTAASTSPIANTGQDSGRLVELGLLGALAVALGSGLVLIGRRRTH